MGWTRRAPAPPSRKGGTGLPTPGASHATQDHAHAVGGEGARGFYMKIHPHMLRHASRGPNHHSSSLFRYLPHYRYGKFEILPEHTDRCEIGVGPLFTRPGSLVLSGGSKSLVVGAKGGKSVRYFDVEGRAGGSRAAFWVRPFRDSDVAGIPNPRECKNFLLPAIRIIIPRIPIIGLRINIDWLSDGWSFRSGHIGGVVTREEQCCLGDLGGLYTITDSFDADFGADEWHDHNDDLRKMRVQPFALSDTVIRRSRLKGGVGCLPSVE